MAAETRCWQCGSSVAQASGFCVVCGARIAVDSPQDTEAGAAGAGGGLGAGTATTMAAMSIAHEQPVAAWRWALLATNCVLLCVCLALTAWNWWDPPRQSFPPAVPGIFATPTAIDAPGAIFTVPATTPRAKATPTPTHTKTSGGHGGSPQATATPTPTSAPTATAMPTPTATLGPTPTPTVTPTPTATPGSEG